MKDRNHPRREVFSDEQHRRIVLFAALASVASEPGIPNNQKALYRAQEESHHVGDDNEAVLRQGTVEPPCGRVGQTGKCKGGIQGVGVLRGNDRRLTSQEKGGGAKGS